VLSEAPTQKVCDASAHREQALAAWREIVRLAFV